MTGTLDHIFNLALLRKHVPDLVVQPLRSLEEWHNWKSKKLWVTDPTRIEQTRTSAAENGLFTFWYGYIPPQQVQLHGSLRYIAGPSWIFERHRMLLDLVLNAARSQHQQSSDLRG